MALGLPQIRSDRTDPDGADTTVAGRDRLELLTALIKAPSFEPVFGADIIRIPAGDPAYPWHCVVAECQRPRTQNHDLCVMHVKQWHAALPAGESRAGFIRAAEPLKRTESLEAVVCRICLHRPAFNRELQICHRHRHRWRKYQQSHRSQHEVEQGAREDRELVDFEQIDFERWVAGQNPCHPYGGCRVRACDDLAESPLGLCTAHQTRYRRAGKPGGAALPTGWYGSFEHHGLAVPVGYTDETAFHRWCVQQSPVMRAGQINLRGLPALVKAEIQWGLGTHARQRGAPWTLPSIQALVNICTRTGAGSLAELDLSECGSGPSLIAREILDGLRCIYFSPSDARDAGFLETEHFGMRFATRSGHVDLTGVSQRWLRDLLWDHLADMLRSPQCPRSPGPMDHARRACLQLSAYLRLEAPEGGDDPKLLHAEHAHGFVADLRHRERHGMDCLGTYRRDGRPTLATEVVRRLIFSYARKVFREALETGRADQLGLSRAFIVAMPVGGASTQRSRSPFPDEVAHALAQETNLALLAEAYDPDDRGMRDIWEAIILTGRRANEILKLRFECLGRYHGLPMLWHDQTKVGNYDEAIRIPEHLHQVLAARQHTTLARFADSHGGRQPTPVERTSMVLFPSNRRSHGEIRAVSYTWFHNGFRRWVDDLDLGHYVPHQARHTMATKLLRHGATLSHIRRYLGHVSDRMAEHYIKVAVSEIEDVLQHVWVTGPGAPNPGELLSDASTPMTRLEAEALAIDLSRRSTPTEGGLCTFQPVVDGGACPWKLDCENCDKFVLTGADLLYWRRKREQWHSIAERAPDDATADYLHQVFEPTGKAIDGLESALAGLGLLDDALALDLRRPQDYFQRLWSLGFRANDLASATTDPDADSDEDHERQEEPA